MYTIFVNESAIFLTDERNKKNKNNFYHYEAIDLTEILTILEKEEPNSVYLYHHDLQFLWDVFKSNFQVIEAAGGVVFNENNEMLWIYRNDRWDLPKGKIEKGEERETAAVREVEEECGITRLKLKKQLLTTYHIYEYKEKKILKVTFWYEMCHNDIKQKLVPQLNEGITKVAWLNNINTNEVLKSTYNNIKLLCKFVSPK